MAQKPTGGDFEKWTARLDTLRFSIQEFADQDANLTQQDIESLATDKLIAALENGEVSPTWNISRTSAEDIHNEALMVYSQVCDYCNEYTQEDKREIIVGDEIQSVCPSCTNDLKNVCNECGRHRDDWEYDEEREVVGHARGIVVEYICSTCAADRED